MISGKLVHKNQESLMIILCHRRSPICFIAVDDHKFPYRKCMSHINIVKNNFSSWLVIAVGLPFVKTIIIYGPHSSSSDFCVVNMHSCWEYIITSTVSQKSHIEYMMQMSNM
jgi:hypothetical protein